MTAPLKPCPFCGGEAEFERKGDRSKSTIVNCNFCGASHESGEEWDHGRAWNTRADAPELLALVEAVRELVSEAWGYGHLFDTPFHAHVHDVLHGKLEAYEALQ